MELGNFDEVFDRVVAETLGPHFCMAITDGLNLGAAGVESLQIIKLIMQLEDELGIFMPMEQLAEYDKFVVVGDLRRACHKLATSNSTF